MDRLGDPRRAKGRTRQRQSARVGDGGVERLDIDIHRGVRVRRKAYNDWSHSDGGRRSRDLDGLGLVIGRVVVIKEELVRPLRSIGKRHEPEMRVLDLSDPDTMTPLHRPGRSIVFDDHLLDNFLALWLGRIVERDITTDKRY